MRLLADPAVDVLDLQVPDCQVCLLHLRASDASQST